MRHSTLPLALLVALALAACGSSRSAATHPIVETVTVTTPAAPATTTALPTPRAPHATGPARTQTGPAFVPATGGTPAHVGDLDGAVAHVRAAGFSPLSTATYRSDNTLRVLVGARAGSADARTQRAFFFDGGRYLGTDSAQDSARIVVGAQSDTAVTLRYALYRPGDALCCPTGGARDVHFVLDMGHLNAADPIPPASAGAPLSRR